MKEICFNEFINLDKRIGKILIVGLEGYGKTLLLSAIAVTKMLRGEKDCWQSYEKVREYNNYGYNFDVKYEHLAFCNFEVNCSGTVIPNREYYPFNPFKIGLSCNDYDTDFFPPGACFFITESRRVFDPYKFANVRPEVLSFWATARQAGYDLICDAHRVRDVNINIRLLLNRILVLFKEIEEIKDDGIVVGHRIYIREFIDAKDADIYENTGVMNNCKEYCLVLKKCFYENYDSYFYRFIHLKGRLGCKFAVKNNSKIFTVEDVENMEDEFGISIPDGYYLNQVKKKSEQSCIEESLDII